VDIISESNSIHGQLEKRSIEEEYSFKPVLMTGAAIAAAARSATG
jgi:hypothetical protein